MKTVIFTLVFFFSLSLFAQNVGINTTSPNRPLSVQGTGMNSEWIQLKDNTGTNQWHLNYLGSGLNFVESGILDGRLYLQDGGNVGINTTAPQTALHIANDNSSSGGLTIGTGTASNGGNLRLLSDANHWNMDNSSGSLRFFTETGYGSGGIERMRILPNGHVAIGITNTSALFHVQGNARFQTGDDISAIITSNDSPTLATVSAVNNDLNGPAGRFIGDVSINGMLSKTAGTFKIDHPLDPENKYLYHSFVESPDMMNLYNGMVELDSNGEAWVTLPEWFETLNMDFRYQLTAIGLPGPNLYIAEKINGNQFKIAGGTAGMEVSWQITGIRQDPYANTYRVQVEEEKSDAERGLFLHPEVYGQPKEKGIGNASSSLIEND